MKIGLQTWGTEGDIRPFLALAGGLSSAGHDVTLAYTSIDNRDYTSLARAMDFDSVKVNKSIADLPKQDSRRFRKTRRPLRQLARVMETYFEPAVDEMYDASERLCRECDLVIRHSVIHTITAAAEKHGCPSVEVNYCPATIASKARPPFGLPHLGAAVNAFNWQMYHKVLLKRVFPSTNRIREKAGLRAIEYSRRDVGVSKDLILLASSCCLSARLPDWGDNIQYCGFLDMPIEAEGWVPPDRLRRFLDAGDDPVFMTFGSMTRFDLEESAQLLLDAATLSGRRTIIQADWEKLSIKTDSPDILQIPAVPYRSVFPHCELVVHHGGSGTLHIALSSGCPSVVVEHTLDQIYWARAIQRVGAAGKPLHHRSITSEKLAAGMETAVSLLIRLKRRLKL